MAKNAFDKFINKGPTGAKKKEAIRQEKRKIKQELRQKGEEERKANEERYRVVTSKDSNTRRGTKGTEQSEPITEPKKNIREQGPSKNVNRTQTTVHRKPSPRYKQGQPIKQTYQQITQKQLSEKDEASDLMPLNKYIAHAGICGRREAALFVKEGKVQVNGVIVFEPGYKVSPNDKVLFKGKSLFLQKNMVYILINKPKDYITTAKDPEGRKTILDLLKGATQERIYPIGRLDRNTTGVLLMTNDGELAQKLTHPSYEIKKIYEVKLDKPVVKKDMEAILNGITLEDGFINADVISYADSKDKSVVGIEIHSGRNRIVRRIFEHLGYDVKNLDRVMFANLTKKNVDRGKWRFLNDKEVRLLKYMNQSFVRAKKEK